jgi:hypothetical protein
MWGASQRNRVSFRSALPPTFEQAVRHWIQLAEPGC